jgi:multidrug efflux system membrane fusion protein
MPRISFHKVAALAVLAISAAWILSGEFSTAGSASQEAGATQADTAVPAAPLRTVAVVSPPRVEHARAIRISGQTEADRRADIATRAGGIIAQLPVRKGDSVRAGDLLLRLDAEEKEAAVDTARQVLAQRQAEAEAAERLAKSGNVPKLQLDSARSAVASARSQLEAATAELARNEVRAPFDGLVDRVTVEEGSSVAQGAQVATILALDPIIASGEVSERDLGFLQLGAAADVRLASGTTVEGTLRYISRDASPQTRTFRVEIAVSNKDKKVPAGMTAEIVLRTGAVDAVVLPRSVVTLSGTGDLGIRAVDGSNQVTFHPIDLVDDTPTGLVLGGIPADARVVVAGQDLVKEGDKVNVVEADAEQVNKLVGGAVGGAQ